MNNLTSNFNLLPLVNFKLILNSAEFANTEFFAVSASIPSISLNEANASYKNYSGFVPGDKIVYDPLNVRIALDENLDSYKEIYSWLIHNSTQSNLKYSDIALLVMSSHNNVIAKFSFINSFPTNMSQIEFNVQQQDVEYTTFDVTFRYDYFKVLSKSEPIIC